jgi:hypothetical protein
VESIFICQLRKLMQNTFLDQVFRDSTGKLVLVQMPNLLIIIWLGSTLLKTVFPMGRTSTGLDAIAFGCLFAWAWEELFQGVNYFRKGLGLLVLVGAIASRIS